MSAKSRISLIGSAVLATGATALVLTGGAAGDQASSKAPKTVTVTAHKSGHSFAYNSITVHQGDVLKIADKTNVEHTFSLVKKKTLPHTVKQFKSCFSTGICGAIAAWHKVGSDGHIHENPVHAGGRGWDKEGSSPKNEGDSVVFTPGKLPKSRPITAPKGTVLHFICAIHPDMQGTITVK